MNEVFDINQLPGRRLSVRKMIALHNHMQIGEAVRIVQETMARQLAATILEGEPFFWSRGDKVAQFSTLEYGADCIVLTTEEYAALKRESFKDGAKHAQGFMPMPNAALTGAEGVRVGGTVMQQEVEK